MCSIALGLMALFIDDLSPHYSYLIEKQKEIMKRGIYNKDLRVLETPEYTGLPIAFDGNNENS